MENKLIILAPMAGFSTSAFRHICHQAGADLCYSEMISDRALIYDSQRTLAMLGENKDDIIQLFGADSHTMGQAAKILVEKGYNNIDINYGCPVPKIFKQGAGSALLGCQDKAVEIAEAVIASGANVSAKLRLGINNADAFLPLALALQKCGVKTIALHARTRKEMFSGRGHWEAFKVLKSALSIPVYANGGIASVEDAINVLKDSGCDGVMIGQAVIGNPLLFTAIKKALNGELYTYTQLDNMKMALQHINLITNDDLIHFRATACSYLKGFSGSAKYRMKAVRLSTKNEFIQLFNEAIASLSLN